MCDNDSILNACVGGMYYNDGNVRYDNTKCYGISYKYMRCIKLLLSQSNINPFIKNKYGYNSFDICKRKGRKQYLTLLNEWQSNNK